MINSIKSASVNPLPNHIFLLLLDPPARERTRERRMLPWPQRLYFWGVHGIFAEVAFTALWEFVVTGNLRLMGVSSLWSFLIYGLGTFLMAESIHNFLCSRKVPLLVRCLVYVLSTYIWEFSCGLLLDYFDARPWDYSDFKFNVMGLITMEYIPVWFLAGLYCEWILHVMKSLEPIPLWKKTI